MAEWLARRETGDGKRAFTGRVVRSLCLMLCSPNCFLSDQEAPPHDMVRFFIRFYDGVAQFVSKIFPSKDVPRVPKGFKLKTRAWGSRFKGSLLMKIHNIMTSRRIL